MRRIRITLAYDGTDYHGWQVQPSLPTIQGTLQQVLARIEGKPVQVTGAGRTDAGVHALAQVAAFDLENRIPPDNLRRAMNRLLPPAIRVLEAREAPPDFHPRRDALSKTYEYRIWRAEICPPFQRLYVHHFPYPLDEERFISAARLFEGEHDFTAFAATDEKDRLGGSKVRRIFSSGAFHEGERLIYRVTGNGFLKHMVRNMVGTLLEVGRGRLDEAGVAELLRSGRPASAGPTAPSCGLFLVEVRYPDGL
ncbi:MAG: tRNA pseudouridine(38-40) synthase TruA [Bryobacterales bacterium]|nr:tRNA pseudouridine(38-40) synthase TruA [Bryobacteraceae bacterium]MDW8129416.1 tRNA pseudouridine(38-40) synthase TruA [Bryobacterales bacterium]